MNLSFKSAVDPQATDAPRAFSYTGIEQAEADFAALQQMWLFAQQTGREEALRAVCDHAVRLQEGVNALLSQTQVSDDAGFYFVARGIFHAANQMLPKGSVPSDHLIAPSDPAIFS